MSLDQQIREQYASRLDKGDLYNSVYALKADLEKSKKLKVILAEFLEIDAQTTILEIGAGQGGNIPMLTQLGFYRKAIFVNELLPERASAVRAAYPEVEVYEGNALEVDFGRQFDVVFQSTVFTSVLNEKDRKDLAGKMWGLLKPGGIIVWYDFIYNNPNNAHVRKVGRHEVRTLFSSAKRSKIQKVTLAPPIGRRVGKLYNLFNLPFLRSQILAVFQQ